MKEEKHILSKPISRRSFILGMTLTGTGVVIGLVPGAKIVADLFDNPDNLAEFQPNVYLQISEENVVTIYVARSEMGQGTRTTFSMILADELDADWDRIVAVQAEGDKKYGNQSTGGSTSVRVFWDGMRKAGAVARDMLLTAAAQTWNINKSECRTENSFVYEKNGNRKLSYGELAAKAANLPVPPADSVKLKNKDEYRLIGTDKVHIDTGDIVSGKAVFGMDVKIPNMKYAVVARPPAFGAWLRSYDDTETLKVKGVTDVIKIPEGIAVIADNTWAAMKGVDLLDIDWELGKNKDTDSKKIFNSLYEKIGVLPDMPPDTVKALDVVYQVPFLSHAPMEPMNATAYYNNGKLEIHTPTQDPQSTRRALANSLKMSEADVTVKMTLVGGGFGRRLFADYSLIAARIAKETGYPVKAVYTRSDDMKHDYYRPASIHAMKGGVNSSGEITAWVHRAIYAGGGSVFSPPYNLPKPNNTSGSGISFVPTGPWRSVANTQVVFANECFFDELAIAAGKDPMDYRINSVNNSRLKNILKMLKEKSEWERVLPKGWGRGVALFAGYGSYVGHVVEVSVIDNKLKVERIVAVCDPGLAINPINIKSQLMGGANDALATALKSEITIKNGGVEQSNFNDFEWIYIDETPEFEAYIIEGSSRPGGMGEVGFPSVSPALCNAIYDATGVRVRKLPVRDQYKPTDKDDKKKIDDVDLKVFPNPFTSSFRVEFKPPAGVSGVITIALSDIKGGKIFEIQRYTGNGSIISEEFYLNSVTAGSYFLNIFDETFSHTVKLIKQ